MEAFIVFALIFWAAPIAVAGQIGVKRNRAGWVYGLCLGWLGVLIVACTSYLPSDAERAVRELEAKQKLNEFQAFSKAQLPPADNPSFVP